MSKFCFKWLVGGQSFPQGKISFLLAILFVAHAFAFVFLLSYARFIHYVMHVEL